MANDAQSKSGGGDRSVPYVREAIDAEDIGGLRADPSDADAKLDVALDESFPTSDAPAHTAPGSSEPAISSGYDEKSERALARKAAWRSTAGKLKTPALIGGGILAIAGLAKLLIGRSGAKQA